MVANVAHHYNDTDEHSVGNEGNSHNHHPAINSDALKASVAGKNINAIEQGATKNRGIHASNPLRASVSMKMNSGPENPRSNLDAIERQKSIERQNEEWNKVFQLEIPFGEVKQEARAIDFASASPPNGYP